MSYARFRWLMAVWWPYVIFGSATGVVLISIERLLWPVWVVALILLCVYCSKRHDRLLRTIHCPHCHVMPMMATSDGPIWFVGVCPSCGKDTLEALIEIRFGGRR